jgi:hypothetical protein
MADDVIGFPPNQVPFGEMDYGGMLTGGAPSGNTSNGYPYDLIDDLPVSSFEPPTSDEYARGGAVHYSGGRGSYGSGYPTRDRGFYYWVKDDGVLTESFWGDESDPDVYFRTSVKADRALIWAYADDGDKQFLVRADNTEAFVQLVDYASPNRYVTIATVDFPTGTIPDTLEVKLREIEICETDASGNPKKILVLCSQPYES